MVQDTMFVNSYFSGIYCKYSKTNSDKFYFDDLFIDGTALSDNVVACYFAVEKYDFLFSDGVAPHRE